MPAAELARAGMFGADPELAPDRTIPRKLVICWRRRATRMVSGSRLVRPVMASRMLRSSPRRLRRCGRVSACGPS